MRQKALEKARLKSDEELGVPDTPILTRLKPTPTLPQPTIVTPAALALSRAKQSTTGPDSNKQPVAIDYDDDDDELDVDIDSADIDDDEEEAPLAEMDDEDESGGGGGSTGTTNNNKIMLNSVGSSSNNSSSPNKSRVKYTEFNSFKFLFNKKKVESDFKV